MKARSARSFQALRVPLVLLRFAVCLTASSGAATAAPTGVEATVRVQGGGGAVGFDRASGRIVFIRQHGSSIAATPAGGDLWSLRLRSGQELRASECLRYRPLTITRLDGEAVRFVYRVPQGGVVTVTASGSPAGIDLRLSVAGLGDDVLDAAVPDDLAFRPASIRRVLFPEHLGIALTPSFYAEHAQPVAWTPEPAGPAGLQRVAGMACAIPPGDTAAIPIHATAAARRALGADVAAAWDSMPEVVDRPPSSPPDLALLTSGAGAYLGGHKVGQGLLMRFGGRLPPYRDDLAANTIERLIADASRSPGLLGLAARQPEERPRVVLAQTRYAPANIRILSLSAADLQSALSGMGVNLDVETADTPGALEADLADLRTLAVVNPYNEAFLSGSDWQGMLDAVHRYLTAGGVWVDAAGGYSFYYHLQGQGYLRLEDRHPSRSFCDFARIESGGAGAVSIYGVQNAHAPGFVVTPSAWDTYGDAVGGHLKRRWQTFLSRGAGGSAPAVRLRFGDIDSAAAVRTYAHDNGIGRRLAAKMPAVKLATWKRSLMVKVECGTASADTVAIRRLPPGIIVHLADYLRGGFDRQYPDHLPPRPDYGTPAQFRQLLAAAHARGDLVMPYTNTTWWPDNPKGPTFQAAGDAPLLIGLDNRHNHEAYGAGSSGWSITPQHPAALASADWLAAQLSREYPVDIVFGDQNGARGMMYDLNPAEPTPYGYTQGMVALATRIAAKGHLPVATEDGFDTLAGVESEFCGLTQELVPFPYDQPGLLVNRMPDEDWEFFPMAQYAAHEDAIFTHHDLGSGVWNPDALAWSLALGYGLSFEIGGHDMDKPATRDWIGELAKLQAKIGPAYVGAPLTSFHYLRGSGGHGVVEAVYGRMSVIANLSDRPYAFAELAVASVVAPHGFRARVGAAVTTSIDTVR